MKTNFGNKNVENFLKEIEKFDVVKNKSSLSSSKIQKGC